MLKKVSLVVSVAVSALSVSPVLAAEEKMKDPAPRYNCDFEPSCEVSPGIYGKMASPALSKFDLSIGGYAKLEYAYNSTNLGNGAPALGSLQPKGIPKTSSPAGQQDQSVITARQSRFWLKAAGPTLLGAKTGGLVEFDLYGNGGNNENPNLRLRHAYGTFDWQNTQLLVGQSWDVFGAAIGSTVDFGSGATAGNPGQPRVPQIRLTQKVNLDGTNFLKLIFAVQNPTQNSNLQTGAAGDSWGAMVNVAGQAMLVSKALGVAPGYYGFSMNSLSAGFFGLYGNQHVAGETGSLDSWGYGFYTFVPLLKSSDGKSRAMTASFEGQAYLASNLSNIHATAAALTGPAGSKSGARGYGVFSQFIFYPTQHLGFAAGYGKRNALNYDRFTAGGTKDFEKYFSHLFANVSYDLNAAVKVMAEYQHLTTKYGNNTAGTSDRGIDNVGRLAFYYFF